MTGTRTRRSACCTCGPAERHRHRPVRPRGDSLRLAGGVGDYGVHVYTRNRIEAVRRYAALFKMNADPLGDEFQQARKRLEGLEQYLVQLWRES